MIILLLSQSNPTGNIGKTWDFVLKCAKIALTNLVRLHFKLKKCFQSFVFDGKMYLLGTIKIPEDQTNFFIEPKSRTLTAVSQPSRSQ